MVLTISSFDWMLGPFNLTFWQKYRVELLLPCWEKQFLHIFSKMSPPTIIFLLHVIFKEEKRPESVTKIIIFFFAGLVEGRQQRLVFCIRPEGLFQICDHCGTLFMERFQMSNHHSSTQRWNSLSKCRYPHLTKASCVQWRALHPTKWRLWPTRWCSLLAIYFCHLLEPYANGIWKTFKVIY